MSAEPLACQALVQRLVAGSDLALSDIVFVAFDTETTGLRPLSGELIELSGVKFKASGEIVSEFSELINPKRPIPPGVTAIHGITDHMVEGAPAAAEVLPRFMRWALDGEGWSSEETVLVAHNARFDVSFVEFALSRLAMPVPTNIVLDSLSLSRRLIDDCPNYRLQTLIDYFGLESQTYHRALADSHHVKNLFLEIVRRLPPRPKLSDLIDAGGKLHFCDLTACDPNHPAARAQRRSLTRALAAGADIKIHYLGVRPSTRIVTPRAVLFVGGKYYLSAYCHNALGERTFRVDRIIRIEMLGGQHE
jgi:DNA polymerase III epsilon subunit family exonuclease